MKSKSISEFLDLLKYYHEQYSELFDEWIACTHPRFLKPDEVYAMQVYKNSDFKIHLGEQVMFYYKDYFILEILDKYEQCEEAYKTWIIKQWHSSLIQLGLEQNLLIFLDTRIKDLKIDPHLKEILLQFKQSSVRDVINLYPEDQLKGDNIFPLLPRCILEIRKQYNVTSILGRKIKNEEGKYINN